MRSAMPQRRRCSQVRVLARLVVGNSTRAVALLDDQAGDAAPAQFDGQRYADGAAAGDEHGIMGHRILLRRSVSLFAPNECEGSILASYNEDFSLVEMQQTSDDSCHQHSLCTKLKSKT